MILNLGQLKNKMRENANISVFADREIIKELILGLDVEESPFIIYGIEPDDDLLMITRIDDTYIVECPFNKNNGKLMLIDLPYIVIENEAITLLNNRRQMCNLVAERLETFTFSEK